MIFPRSELETYGFGIELTDEETLRGLDRLAHLQHLHRAGYWSRLTESNVEQSFVERVFGDIFKYTTLLAPETRGASPDILPKLYVPLASGGRAFPDFAVGHFRADERSAVVTAELKSPGAALDTPQGGQYQGRTPVEQAMEAATAANAEWCVVSNTTELRLYRVPDATRFESVNLLEVVSPFEFRRAYSLFGRRSLLGAPGQPSPLTRLHRHHVAGESMLVPGRPDRVRLVQRLRPRGTRNEIPFNRLSQYLEKALTSVPAVNVLSGEFLRPRLQDDQLVFERGIGGDVWQRVVLFKSGLSVCSYLVPLDRDTGADQPILIDPSEVAMLLCDMTAFGLALHRSINAEIVYEWSLEDLNGRAIANDGRRWTRPSQTRLTCQASVGRTAYPETQLNVNSMKPDSVAELLTDVVRELFFPFEGTDTENRLCRLEPTRQEVVAFLGGIDSFKAFS
jgi:hypothetical protein